MILFSILKEFVIQTVAQGVLSLIEQFRMSFIQWLQKIPEMIQDKVDGVVYGCKTFVGEKLGINNEISDNYSFNGRQWQKTTVSREVSSSEIPDEIKSRMVSGTPLDMTEELELSLK